MQYHPKLKKAIKEIQAILDEYDIAGLVVLHSPGYGLYFSEYLLKIDPSYSCAKFNGEELRVRAKLHEDFKGDKKAWEEKMKATSSMLNSLGETSGRMSLSLFEISEMVDEKIDAEHRDLGHTSQTTQDN